MSPNKKKARAEEKKKKDAHKLHEFQDAQQEKQKQVDDQKERLKKAEERKDEKQMIESIKAKLKRYEKELSTANRNLKDFKSKLAKEEAAVKEIQERSAESEKLSAALSGRDTGADEDVVPQPHSAPPARDRDPNRE